ncbi:MAG: tRNA cyclic N6-threonylcarbamoyladenosine(37) synthase TcdA [Gammaproteobacteria bacterium]|jgi:tRNA A37 threonylcarbamoyladenosine dehydratase|nr:tRNA cyclic N6-threonylcarbamoyladenosine(37) synthase TcdA [Gammaproteobacteria bacterium]MDP6166743.1 tRNA cyclic N6-threonylcarbamoyladenosine(37) synthase TcdA [Gammaproteobacteria bacterium]
MTDLQHRFGGIQRLYGLEAFQTINQAHICIIGIGGVGTWVAEACARSGVGKLTLIDMDDVCETNINRQIVALDSTIEQAKVDVMAARIADINPACQVTVIEDFIGPSNMAEYLDQGYDYVVDACDSIKAKAAVIYWCKRNKIPVLTIGGAGGQKDPTQVRVADLSQTKADPLAAKLRNTLRRHYGFSENKKRKFGVECVYSTEQLVYPHPDGSVCFAKHENVAGAKMDCSRGFGAVSFVTGSFAFVAVSRLLDKLIAKSKRQKVKDSLADAGR